VVVSSQPIVGGAPPPSHAATIIGGEIGFGGTITDIPAEPYGGTFGLFILQTLDTDWVFGARGAVTIGPPNTDDFTADRYDYFVIGGLVDFGYEWRFLDDVFALRPFLGLGLELLFGGNQSVGLSGLTDPALTFTLQPSAEAMFLFDAFAIGVRGGLRVAFHDRPARRPEVSFPVSLQASVVAGYRFY
jgi:hypothetical protein